MPGAAILLLAAALVPVGGGGAPALDAASNRSAPDAAAHRSASPDAAEERSSHVRFSWSAAGDEARRTEALEVTRVTPAVWLTRHFLAAPDGGRRAIVTEMHLPREGRDVYRVLLTEDGSWFELCTVSGLRLGSTSDMTIAPLRAERLIERDYPVEMSFSSSRGDRGRIAAHLRDAAPELALARSLAAGPDGRQLTGDQEAALAWLSGLAAGGDGDEVQPLAGFQPLLRLVVKAFGGGHAAGEPARWVLNGYLHAPAHRGRGEAVTEPADRALLARFAGIDARDPLAGAAAIGAGCEPPAGGGPR
jgi:hypothetical protein